MSAPTDAASLRRLEPAAVKQILEDGNAREAVAILDVRDADEVAAGAIAGRRHLASTEFHDDGRVDALLDELAEAGKRTVIVHCMHSQKRGPACAARLADRIKAREAGAARRRRGRRWRGPRSSCSQGATTRSPLRLARAAR